MFTMPAVRTPASDKMCSEMERVRTLEPSLAKRTTVSSFSMTRDSPVRSGGDFVRTGRFFSGILTPSDGDAAEVTVWAKRAGKKQASAAKAIDRAGMDRLF